MKRKNRMIAALLVICICLAGLLPAEVYAASKYKSEWVEKSGRYYYYNEKGKKLTGLVTIGDSTYYFDEKGRQRTGWVQIGDDYYFFALKSKAKGAMQTAATVNGIKLKKDGTAKVTKKNAERLRLLCAANEMVFTYTKNTMKKSEKLWAMFSKMSDHSLILYKNLGSFRADDADWPEFYAAYLFDKGYGDCYASACGFGYIALAIGYEKVYVQSSGTHGWCRIGGKYYDPNWATWGTQDITRAYAVPPELSGEEGRLSWKELVVYSEKIG